MQRPFHCLARDGANIDTISPHGGQDLDDGGRLTIDRLLQGMDPDHLIARRAQSGSTAEQEREREHEGKR